MLGKHCRGLHVSRHKESKEGNKPSLRSSLRLSLLYSHIYFSVLLISNVIKTTTTTKNPPEEKKGRKRKRSSANSVSKLTELNRLIFKNKTKQTKKTWHYFAEDSGECSPAAPGSQSHFRSRREEVQPFVPLRDSGKCGPGTACSPGLSASGVRGRGYQYLRGGESVPRTRVSSESAWAWNLQVPPSPLGNRSRGGQGRRFSSPRCLGLFARTRVVGGQGSRSPGLRVSGRSVSLASATFCTLCGLLGMYSSQSYFTFPFLVCKVELIVVPPQQACGEIYVM